MDRSYNPHAERARRNNRSSTNVNHLSLAPLTSKLPIGDGAIAGSSIPLPRPSTSYLQGKSAPTTPRLLASSATNPRSSSRHHNRTPSAPGAPIARSKSSSSLASTNVRRPASGTSTPGRRHGENKLDGDWLLRTGALMTFEAREFKGQSWLASRQSSTSFLGMQDAEEEAFELELAREREMTSRRASRRGSIALADDETSVNGSRAHSRFHSRSHSIVDGRSQLLTPLDRAGDDSYFPAREPIVEPDFIDLDEKLEELEQDTVEDVEADVKRLMRRGNSGKRSWIGMVIGWPLLSVDEHEEGSDEDSGDDESSADVRSQADRRWCIKRQSDQGSLDPEDLAPPLVADEGGWTDAAWLLSVATKVIF